MPGSAVRKELHAGNAAGPLVLAHCQPTPFTVIFECRARGARRNVTTRSPHAPELEFLDEELTVTVILLRFAE
jgi:hypothetical protein